MAGPPGGPRMISVAVTHRFDGFTLDAAFDAPAGVTALFGRSGAGKTTLVDAIAGLIRPDSARIALGDRVLADTARGIHLPPHRRRVGYVFQHARLFPHMTVAANLAYGRRDATDTDRIVDMLDIGSLRDRRPATLSGGERSRVAIGRALLSSPDLLLMDEPLASLDAGRKAEILPYLARLRDEARLPILYVSHSLPEIAQLATTLVLLEAGRVVRAGPLTDLLSDPALVTALGVRDAGAVLTGRVTARAPDGLAEIAISGGTLTVADPGLPVGAAVRIRIEAQEVILSAALPVGLSALNVLAGTIDSLHAGGGPGTMVRVRVGDAALLARITRRSAVAMDLAPGQAIHAIVKTVAVSPDDIGGMGNGGGAGRDNPTGGC